MRYKREMTSRERVLTALNHQEPDRVPIAVGASNSSSMVAEAYEDLKRCLNVQTVTQYMFGKAGSTVAMDEVVLQLLGSDVRGVFERAAPSVWQVRDGQKVLIDEWGIGRQRSDSCSTYYIISHPLSEATIDDLARYPWPSSCDPKRVEGLADQAASLRKNTEYAVMGSPEFLNLFERAVALRGMQQLLLDIVLDETFFHALMRRIVDIYKERLVPFLDAVGPYIDLIRIGDDIASQRGGLVSPDTYRRMIKPYHKELISFIKERTDAKVYFHCCGNVASFIEDFIEVGVDVLDPVQVAAVDMDDTASLKKEFGDRICFCGAIDTQHVLPCGSPEEVEAEVRRRIRDLAPGGGYMVASVHTVQPDVPGENVVAMCRAAREYGQYPIS